MLDVKKEMTFEEVKNFFSATEEFTVEYLPDKDERNLLLRITYTDSSPRYTHKCSSLMAKVTIQLLIRKIHQLSYNMAVKNYD